MIARKLTLIYLTTYLAIGGIGLAFFPLQILKLFFSNGDYGDIMPRLVGMFMGALSYIIFRIVRNEDWQYYSVTIYVRSIIVLFLFWLHYKSQDPLFLVLNGIVLIGLVPSIVIHLKTNDKQPTTLNK